MGLLLPGILPAARFLCLSLAAAAAAAAYFALDALLPPGCVGDLSMKGSGLWVMGGARSDRNGKKTD